MSKEVDKIIKGNGESEKIDYTDEEINSMLLNGPEYDGLPDFMRIDPMLYVPKPVED